MWKRVTSVERREQGIVVLLDSLEGNSKAEKAVSDFTDTDLYVDDGLKKLLDKLDAIFKEEKVNEAYRAYAKFDKFQRPEGMSIDDYILDFDYLYAKMYEHGLQLPDVMKAFRLLDGANLEEGDRKFAMKIAGDMEFDTMKGALKLTFSGSVSHLQKSLSSSCYIKPKEAFYSKKYSQQSSSKMVRFTDPRKTDDHNPPNSSDNISRCVVCDSGIHDANQGPHSTRKQSANITDNVEEHDREEDELFLMGEHEYQI